MNLKDSEQIRKRLEEEYNKNCSNIDDLNEKIGVITANDFETKVGFAMVFSILPWITAILAMSAIIKSGVIPLNLVQPLCVFLSCFNWYNRRRIIYKKVKMS